MVLIDWHSFLIVKFWQSAQESSTPSQTSKRRQLSMEANQSLIIFPSFFFYFFSPCVVLVTISLVSTDSFCHCLHSPNCDKNS